MQPTHNSFAEQIIVFSAIEGIFFSGSFCTIFWIKKHKHKHGLGFSNKLISHNNGLHCNFTCLLYSKLINRQPEARVVAIISSEVKIEMESKLKWILDSTPSPSNPLEWIQPWCASATTPSYVLNNSWSPLVVVYTEKSATCPNGWKWSAFGESKLLWK